MSNNYFCFKQFAIEQDNAPMKVGTDGVLIGAWCNCNNARKVLDVGTGTGLVAIMVAQRSEAMVSAVEIDANACLDAMENFGKCPWPKRIELFNLSIQEFAGDCTDRFDLIVSNPPFFNNSLKAPDAGRTLARHTDSLPASDLFECASKLLADNGCLSVIIPVGNFEEYCVEAEKHKMRVLRKAWVKPTDELPCHRVMVEFGYSADMTSEETIVIEQGGRHCYSPEYIALTQDFYLKF